MSFRSRSYIVGLLEAEKQFKDRATSFNDDSIGREAKALLVARSDITSLLFTARLAQIFTYYIAWIRLDTDLKCFQ